VNPWDPQARAYAALQRYYVLIDPGSAENGWQEEHRFAALPQAQRTPGHWYRNAGEAGFIHYKLDGSGQFHETLPAGVEALAIQRTSTSASAFARAAPGAPSSSRPSMR